MYKLFITENLDPWYNLSMENWLLKRDDLKNSKVIFIYRNKPTVVIGRFQNPWLECNIKEMVKQKICLVRRQSGGGAVYHDEGNSNFSFIEPNEGFSRTKRTDLIIESLKSEKIDARQGNRYDIYVNNSKISGSASKYTSGKVIHHGTLLIDADLKALNNYLISKFYRNGTLKSKGIKSVRSEVTNLKTISPDFDHETFIQSLLNILTDNKNNKPEVFNIGKRQLKEIPEIQKYYEKITNWDWIYGVTPSFTIDYEFNDDNIQKNYLVSVKKGIISKIETESDSIKNAYLNRPFEDLLF